MKELVKLAKETVEAVVKEGRIMDAPADFPKEFLRSRAGVFVTIEKDAENGEKTLRGCIGTYLPVQENIARETIRNAIAAATEDDRFVPLAKEELPFLHFTVCILEKPELVRDKSMLDPRKYGILVKSLSSPAKAGLLLPDLEGIETPDQQFAIACQKGGINPKNEKIILYRFAAQKYK